MNISLEQQAGEWLRKKNLKLVLAESCTGGLISHLITNVPGSSDYYLGGINAYAYEAKERLLGVKHETLTQYGAVSQETVIEMAQGARRMLAQDFSIETLIGMSVSGIAGPGGGMPGKPVGLVWVGLSAAQGDFAWKYVWQGNREENKDQSAHEVLRILVAFLQGNLDV